MFNCYNFRLSDAYYNFVTAEWDVEWDDRPDIDLMFFLLGEGQ